MGENVLFSPKKELLPDSLNKDPSDCFLQPPTSTCNLIKKNLTIHFPFITLAYYRESVKFVFCLHFA